MRPHVVHWLDSWLPSWLAQAVAPSWFTCVGLAGLVTLFVMLAIASRHRLDPGVVASIVMWCYIAAVSAGILVPMALDAVGQLIMTRHVHLRWAGMTSFWGYLAGIGAVTAVCRAHSLPLARLGDLAAAPLGVAVVLARLGCFLGGCDYGKVSSVPWAMRFPSGSPAWHDHVNAGLVPADRAESLPVHPTQLYEAALGLVIVAAVLLLGRRRWARSRTGRRFLIAAVVYALGRILVESVRGDAGRGIYLGLSSGQIFSLLALIAIAGGWLVRRSRLVAVAAAGALVLAAPQPAYAQPPQPQPPFGPAPSAPEPAPGDPYAQPDGAPPEPPDARLPAPRVAAPTAAPVPRAAGESADDLSLHAGVLLGVATPLNRRRDQVAMLGGPSISLGLARRGIALWLDLDSFGNTDASHGTVLIAASAMSAVANNLQIGGRVGLGATLVNFDDPAFRDVAGTTVRFEALAEYRVSDSWAVWLRPVSFDMLSAAALGGPIITWQVRVGVGYHAVVGHRSAARSPVPATPYPAAPYPSAAAAPYQPVPAAPYPSAPAAPYAPAPPYPPAPAAPYPPAPPYQSAPSAPYPPAAPYPSAPAARYAPAAPASRPSPPAAAPPQPLPASRPNPPAAAPPRPLPASPYPPPRSS